MLKFSKKSSVAALPQQRYIFKSISLILLLILGVFAATLLTACKKEEAPPATADTTPVSPTSTINISAASSLTESLSEIKDLYLKNHPELTINLNFAASSTLKTQIQQGADVDLFLSANFSHYDDLDKAGSIEEGREFAENSLVLAVASSNNNIQKVEDIQAEGTKIIFANDNVPVGKYTLKILEKYDAKLGNGFAEKVNTNVVSKEENVRQVLSKVALGEGDCAIVYDTDITADVKEKVRVVKIDDDCNVKGEYWAGVLKKNNANPESKNFYDFLSSDEAKSVFEKYGFTAK